MPSSIKTKKGFRLKPGNQKLLSHCSRYTVVMTSSDDNQRLAYWYQQVALLEQWPWVSTLKLGQKCTFNPERVHWGLLVLDSTMSWNMTMMLACRDRTRKYLPGMPLCLLPRISPGNREDRPVFTVQEEDHQKIWPQQPQRNLHWKKSWGFSAAD